MPDKMYVDRAAKKRGCGFGCVGRDLWVHVRGCAALPRNSLRVSDHSKIASQRRDCGSEHCGGGDHASQPLLALGTSAVKVKHRRTLPLVLPFNLSQTVRYLLA